MKNSIRFRFGCRVRELRNALGISQEAFADKCGFARSYMSRVERGGANPSLDAVQVLADALNVDVQQLFVFKAKVHDVKQNEEELFLVPFAEDGTYFHPSLRRPRSGKYTVGPKGKEAHFDSFYDALKYLSSLPVAYWRRPNKAGNWGIVVAVRWDVLPDAS